MPASLALIRWNIKVVGGGLRNPTGLAFDEEGKLFAVNHGADQRGSRPLLMTVTSLMKLTK